MMQWILLFLCSKLSIAPSWSEPKPRFYSAAQSPSDPAAHTFVTSPSFSLLLAPSAPASVSGLHALPQKYQAASWLKPCAYAFSLPDTLVPQLSTWFLSLPPSNLCSWKPILTSLFQTAKRTLSSIYFQGPLTKQFFPLQHLSLSNIMYNLLL